MNIYKYILAAAYLFFLSIDIFADPILKSTDAGFSIKGRNYSVFLSPNGALESLNVSEKDIKIRAFEPWELNVKNGSPIKSSSASARSECDGKTISFYYDHKDADVKLTVEPQDDYIDFKAYITTKNITATSIKIPSKVVFEPKEISKISFITSNPRNMGLELNGKFFEKRDPAGINFSFVKSESNSGEAAATLFGRDIVAAKSGTASLRAGRDAEEWLGKDAVNIISGIKANISRPFKNSDISIIETENGIFFGGSKLGGKGAIFRLGGYRKDIDSLGKLFSAIYKKAKSENAGTKRTKVGVITFLCDTYNSSNFAGAMRKHFPENEFFNIFTIKDMLRAMESDTTLMIINPFEELCPTPAGKSLTEFVNTDVRKFVKEGGYWMESGGYPFFYTLRPIEYLSALSDVVADFSHFEFDTSKFAAYSVQPAIPENFGGKNPLMPIFTGFKGNDEGAVVGRIFPMRIQSSQTLETPTTRILFGKNLVRSAKSFSGDNKILKKLNDKGDAAFLKKFKEYPIIRIEALNISMTKDVAEKVPHPSIIHIFTYMRGNFDRQYPDHFPPRPSYATPESLREFIDFVHSKGSLFMPYMNNTWWCDNPKGPTFEKHKEAPLLKDEYGKPHKEVYGPNMGYTACMWHPEVLAINSKLITQFTDEYPSDIVFQDQTGSRSAAVDFNPASPTINSYMEGLVMSTYLDAKRKPLSTEDGNSFISDCELQFCGMSFGIMEPKTQHKDSHLVWEMWPKECVSLSNVVGAIFHDKLSICQHNLGGTIHCPQRLAINLAYGMHMIVEVNEYNRSQFCPEFLEWVKWIDAIQKEVASRYMGEEMRKFKWEWNNPESSGTDAVCRAQYGLVKIVSNISDNPLVDGEFEIAPNSFVVRAPDLLAACISGYGGKKTDGVSSFIITDKNLYVFGIGGGKVTVPAGNLKGDISLLLNGQKITPEIKDNALIFALPETKETYPMFWKFEIAGQDSK